MSILVNDLKLFLSGKESFTDYLSDKNRAYTNSPDYLVYCLSFHGNVDVAAYERAIDPPPGTRFIDVGCLTGTTGLNLALRGYPVTFHDFEGLALEFIRWFSDKHKLDTAVIPYGDELPEQYDIATAFDVLEHTGNHLAFIKWISGLARTVYICYPLSIPFSPPYVNVLDEWVDDEIIRCTVNKRYKIIGDQSPNNDRRFLVWNT